MCLCLHVCVQMCACICVCAPTCVCIYVCMSVCACMCASVYMHHLHHYSLQMSYVCGCIVTIFTFFRLVYLQFNEHMHIFKLMFSYWRFFISFPSLLWSEHLFKYSFLLFRLISLWYFFSMRFLGQKNVWGFIFHTTSQNYRWSTWIIIYFLIISLLDILCYLKYKNGVKMAQLVKILLTNLRT